MNQNKLSYWYHLLAALLAFFISSCVAVGCISLISGEALTGEMSFTKIISFINSITDLGKMFWIFFLPILLIVSIIIWRMTHKRKYFISFLLMIIYGYFLNFFLRGEDTENLVWSKENLFDYFLISIPTLILFFVLFNWLTNFFAAIIDVYNFKNKMY